MEKTKQQEKINEFWLRWHDYYLTESGERVPIMSELGYRGAMNELADWVRQECAEKIGEMSEQLNEGRHYLMGVEADQITVEDALEAFGFGRNGLKDR